MAVPAGLFYWLRVRKATVSLLPFIAAAERTRGGTGGYSLERSLGVRGACFALAWILLAFAAAGPRWGTKLVASRQEGSSVVFVIDISRSMTLGDVAPSRLSYAAQYASLLMERMERTPCGLVLAKGEAILALPVTTDHRALRDLLASLSPALLTSPGSAPGKGVIAALSAFPKNSAQSRTIVLFSDGDETGSSLDDAARAVRTSGARLLIVGCGSAAGAAIRIYPDSDNQETHDSRLREDLLEKTAASAGNGSFYVQGNETGSAFRVLDAVLSSAALGSRLVYSSEPVTRHFEFLLAALAAFLAGILTGGFVWQRK